MLSELPLRVELRGICKHFGTGPARVDALVEPGEGRRQDRAVWGDRNQRVHRAGDAHRGDCLRVDAREGEKTGNEFHSRAPPVIGIYFGPEGLWMPQRNLGARAALKTLASVDPCRERLERSRQWFHLADATAGVGIGKPQFAIGILA